MLIHCRRRPYLCLFSLLVIGVVVVYEYHSWRVYLLTDEHRIYTSLLAELPRLERILRVEQRNLSSTRKQLIQTNDALTRSTWHLQRLLKTIDAYRNESKRIFRSNTFDFDLERRNERRVTRFRVYFHSIGNIVADDVIDFDRWHEVHRQFVSMRTPYVTRNISDAHLKLIYLPLRSARNDICLKTTIDNDHMILYEFLQPLDNDVNEKCFGVRSLPVKLFTQLPSDSSSSYNDRWRDVDDTNNTIGIVHLNTTRKSTGTVRGVVRLLTTEHVRSMDTSWSRAMFVRLF
jgi:hypothetical protein